MKKKIILVIFILWAFLIIFDCFRLKLDEDNKEWNKPIICLYEDSSNRKYYGLGYSYELETKWHNTNNTNRIDSIDVSYGTKESHFKLLYIIPIW